MGGLGRSLTLLTPMTLLPACAALAAVCDDIVAFCRAASAQLKCFNVGALDNYGDS
jgi:hypothetical protein